MMMISLLLSVILVSVFCLPCYADTLSAIANTDPESSTVGLLIDAMRSDPDYDPYNQYVVVRTSDYQYKLAFAPDLDGSSVVYTYTQGYGGSPASISRSTASSIQLQKNGFYVTGNISGTLSSTRAETYKYQSVIVVAVICLVAFFILRVFRRTHAVKSSYYNVR